MLSIHYRTCNFCHYPPNPSDPRGIGYSRITGGVPHPKCKFSTFSSLRVFLPIKKCPKKPHDEETLLAKALEAYETQKLSSLRKAADHYRVSYSKLRGCKTGRTSLSDRPTTNNALNLNQENALISWVKFLNSC